MRMRQRKLKCIRTAKIQKQNFDLIGMQIRSFWSLTFCLDTIQDFIVGTNTLPSRICTGW